MLFLASLLVAIAIGFAGLAVDVRNGYVVRTMLQHAVDDGALSAQRWSAQVRDTPGGGSPDALSGAVAEGMRAVQRELQANGVAGISSAGATLTGGRLTLAARAHVRTFFLPLFGIGSWLPEAQADAVLWAPGMSALPAVSSPGGSAPAGPSQIAPMGSVTGLSAGEGGGVAAPDFGTGAALSPDSAAPPGGASPDQTGDANPCNCDAIAAGDPQAAREALDRVGATPADPGPFQGDLTSAMGFGEMQSDAAGGGGVAGADAAAGASGADSAAGTDGAGGAADGAW